MLNCGLVIPEHTNDTTNPKKFRVSRRRASQVGAAVAAVGLIGVTIGCGSPEESQSSVHDAALQAPIPAPPVPQQGGPENPTPAAPPAPEQQPAGAPPVSDTPAEPEAPLGPPVEGIDVSNHNGDIDWGQVAADGKKFTFVLATDGTSFTNPRYGEQYRGAKEAGLLAGAYHFARPGSSSAEEQAERFLDVADHQADGKTLPPVLDLEVDPEAGGCYGLSVDQMQQWTTAFNEKVKERTGEEAIIYANPSFWRDCMGGTDSFKDHALWLASYDVENPAVPEGFDDWDFWQYTSKGEVPGIGTNTDLNEYKEGLARLERLAR